VKNGSMNGKQPTNTVQANVEANNVSISKLPTSVIIYPLSFPFNPFFLNEIHNNKTGHILNVFGKAVGI